MSETVPAEQPPTGAETDRGLIAWRHPRRGKAHRANDFGRAACSDLTMRGYEQAPLVQTAREDRCRLCWRSAAR